MFYKIFILALTFMNVLQIDATADEIYDVIVYGGTSSGVIASIQAVKMGKSTLLIEPGNHLGGMTSSGLSWVDVQHAGEVGGLAKEFFNRVWMFYQDDTAWKYEAKHEIDGQASSDAFKNETMWVLEPHVAENIFNSMVAEANVPVVLGERLDRLHGVKKNGNRINTIVMESGKSFQGRMFIDASYEGDLMASAGVSYIVGRESNSQYGETLNGIHPDSLHLGLLINPYVIKGDPTSGLLSRISPNSEGNPGDGDKGVPAYCYRLCLTKIPSNRIMIKKPVSYNDQKYKILFRYLESSANINKNFFTLNFIPNQKIDANNNGPVSMDYVGMSWNYAEAGYNERKRIANRHKKWQKGLIWTLQNHPRIPQNVRDFYAPWGLAKDEFTDNNHWPPLLYIREARRMISDVVITELTARGQSQVNDGIAMCTYPMDSHVIKYFLDGTKVVRSDGGMYTLLPNPFSISYGAIVPKQLECENLLVPVCVSASHVAFGTIRTEPVIMVLGQSAATAACLAIDLGVVVQDVPYDSLREQLLADNQVIN